MRRIIVVLVGVVALVVTGCSSSGGGSSSANTTTSAPGAASTTTGAGGAGTTGSTTTERSDPSTTVGGSTVPSAPGGPDDLAHVKTAVEKIGVVCQAPKPFDPKDPDSGFILTTGIPAPIETMDCTLEGQKVKAVRWSSAAKAADGARKLDAFACGFDAPGLSYVTRAGWIISVNNEVNVDNGKQTDNQATVLRLNPKLAAATHGSEVHLDCRGIKPSN